MVVERDCVLVVELWAVRQGEGGTVLRRIRIHSYVHGGLDFCRVQEVRSPRFVHLEIGELGIHSGVCGFFELMELRGVDFAFYILLCIPRVRKRECYR